MKAIWRRNVCPTGRAFPVLLIFCAERILLLFQVLGLFSGFLTPVRGSDWLTDWLRMLRTLPFSPGAKSKSDRCKRPLLSRWTQCHRRSRRSVGGRSSCARQILDEWLLSQTAAAAEAAAKTTKIVETGETRNQQVFWVVVGEGSRPFAVGVMGACDWQTKGGRGEGLAALSSLNCHLAVGVYEWMFPNNSCKKKR